MKGILHTCILIVCVLVSVSVNAQYCGNSGPSVCTPQSGAPLGFTPPDTSLPCSVDNVPYSQVITFVTPSTISGYTLQNIQLAVIENLPCGLCWASNVSSNNISGGGSGCIKISGTTLDAPGEYQIVVYASATVSGVPVLGTLTVGPLNIDSLEGLKYFGRVEVPGGQCAPINNSSNGLNASTRGNISTPTISGNSTVCDGGSTSLSVSGGNYYGFQWSNGDITSTANVTAAGTYTVTVYENCNSATASKTITSAPAPTASVTPGNETVCSGSLVGLTASGGGTYRWNVGSTTASINVTPTTTKTYTVTVTAANSCTAAASTTLTVGASASATISPAAVSMCSGHDTTLVATGGTTYAWSTGATGSSISVSPASTTVYTVTASSGSCSASASRTVNISALQAVVTANGPTSLCSGGSVTLTVTSGYTSYLWSTGATGLSITVSESGAYSCSVTNAAGCSGVSNVVNISISSGGLTPTVTASNSFSLCPGGVTTLDAGIGYDTYNWNVGVGTETIEVSNTDTGIYNYTVTVTQGACSGSTAVSVHISNNPVVVSVSPPSPISVCAGIPVTIDAGAGYSTYAWSNNATTETIQATTAGNYYITVTQNNACTGSAGVSVAFNPVPSVSITPADSQSICNGGSIALDAGPGFESYAWSNGDSTQVIQVQVSGNYSVVVSNNGCQAASDTVSVNALQAIVPAINPAGNQTVCTNHNLVLSADNTYDTYLWSNGATTQSIAVDSAGVYNLSVTQSGCKGSSISPTTVTAVTSPGAVLVANTITDNYVVLQAGPASANFQWLIQTPSGNDSVIANIQQYDTAGCSSGGTFYKVITTQNGCSDTSGAVEALCSGQVNGIANISAITNFAIEPNPASDVLNIIYNLHAAANIQISIVDITGRLVMPVKNEMQSGGSYKQQINISALPQGIYLLKLTSNSTGLNKKFVKQ